MLLPEQNGYLLEPDAPVLSAALPRTQSVTVKHGTRQACHVGTYQTTTDVTSLVTALSGYDGYLYFSPKGVKLQPNTDSPTLQPYDASLFIAGESTIANYNIEISLDGIPTGIHQIDNLAIGQSDNCEVYSLSGQKINYKLSTDSKHSTLNTQLKRGVYIVNGRKVSVW